ncbi:uncharacterized protein LOC141664660 [Apium graveolens]|uniref:uncharacterized protein LOC141664660 n=1 Tax=Apium graveolens TaxID=4045 RepID=UPI003D7B4F1B
MKVFMEAQDVWDTIDPKDPKAKVKTRTDKVALAAIYQGTPEDILLSVAEKRTTKEAWEAVKIMCVGAERVQKAKIQTLHAELDSLKMRETDILDDFCMNLYGWVTKIRVLRETMQEIYVVKKLLRAVPAKKPRRDKEQKPEVNMAQVDDEEPVLLLTECGEQNNGVILLNEGSVVPQLRLDTTKEVELNLWYLDNGARNHMTGIHSKFSELNENVTRKVHFGDGSTVEIKGKGSVIFKCKNGENHLVKDVYFILSLCNNIISLGQLSEDGKKVVLLGEFLWVYDEHRCLLMKVKRSSNRLYKAILK